VDLSGNLIYFRDESERKSLIVLNTNSQEDQETEQKEDFIRKPLKMDQKLQYF
jgi:hypothetical protein